VQVNTARGTCIPLHGQCDSEATAPGKLYEWSWRRWNTLCVPQEDGDECCTAGIDSAEGDWWRRRGRSTKSIRAASLTPMAMGSGPARDHRPPDHIASLVWMRPGCHLFKSPMKDFGYDVSDYCDVDPIFARFRTSMRSWSGPTRLNLRVIIDQVFSHTSDQHPWFRRAARAGLTPSQLVCVGRCQERWVTAFQTGSPSSATRVGLDARRGQYYLHNFLTEQPDLNVHNPAVQDALLETGRFWLERGVDGFRVDAIDYAMHDPSLTTTRRRKAAAKHARAPLTFRRRGTTSRMPTSSSSSSGSARLQQLWHRFTVPRWAGKVASPP